jgi:superfamily II DNA helicase RecQ
MPSYQEQINDLAQRVAALEARGTLSLNAPRPREPEPGDEQLFAALSAWRYDRANVEGLPPYRIFGNAVLAAVSAAKPADRYEMQQIHGIGPEKLALYGDEMIAIVRSHLDGDW